jgi:hypothetical protein
MFSTPYGLRIAQGTSGAGAAVTVTVAGVTGQTHYLHGVQWSYSAAPTGGRLTSSGLVGDDVDLDVTEAGPESVECFGAPAASGGALAVTLAAPGGAVVGKVAVVYRTV